MHNKSIIFIMLVLFITSVNANNIVVLGNQDTEISKQRVSNAELLINNETEIIIFSGGKTNNNTISEANEMAQSYSGEVPYILEENSTNTLQNALYVKKILKDHPTDILTVVSTNHWYACPIFKGIFAFSNTKIKCKTK